MRVSFYITHALTRIYFNGRPTERTNERKSTVNTQVAIPPTTRNTRTHLLLSHTRNQAFLPLNNRKTRLEESSCVSSSLSIKRRELMVIGFHAVNHYFLGQANGIAFVFLDDRLVTEQHSFQLRKKKIRFASTTFNCAFLNVTLVRLFTRKETSRQDWSSTQWTFTTEQQIRWHLKAIRWMYPCLTRVLLYSSPRTKSCFGCRRRPSLVRDSDAPYRSTVIASSSTTENATYPSRAAHPMNWVFYSLFTTIEQLWSNNVRSTSNTFLVRRSSSRELPVVHRYIGVPAEAREKLIGLGFGDFELFLEIKRSWSSLSLFEALLCWWIAWNHLWRYSTI